MNTTENGIYIWLFVVPISVALTLLLVYITVKPLFKGIEEKRRRIVPHITEAKIKEFSESVSYHKIAIAVDFSTSDKESIATALQLGGKDAEYILIHVVETPGALVYGGDIDDYETVSDKKFLNSYKIELEARGYTIETQLGFGSPKKSIPKIVNEKNMDLLVLGRHGHKGFKDILFGTTVDSVRHKVKVPVFIV